jgi:hypothetical protein
MPHIPPSASLQQYLAKLGGVHHKVARFPGIHGCYRGVHGSLRE